MSKFAKPQYEHHTIRLRCDGNDGELLLIRTGRYAYIWAAKDGNSTVLTFTGQQTLRKLARAILTSIPERKRRKSKP